MKKYKAKAVNSGIAIAKIAVFIKNNEISKYKIINCQDELQRLKSAFYETEKQLKSIIGEFLERNELENAQILQAYLMIIKDEEYIRGINSIIETELVNAEYAIDKFSNDFADKLLNVNDVYMKARALDFKDISSRIINNLEDENKSLIEKLNINNDKKLLKDSENCNENEPVIIVAEELNVSQIIKMDYKKIAAFVITKGMENSHSIIIARSFNIPLIIELNLNIKDVKNGMTAIINNGELIIEPDQETLLQAKLNLEEYNKSIERLAKYKDCKLINDRGQLIKITANIDKLEESEFALNQGADAIGLFRTEFLYLSKKVEPGEELQFNTYKKLLEQMKGKEVVIRTFDLGNDKNSDSPMTVKEDNPALGLRGIRLCLEKKDMFKRQLSALYRAAVFGNLSIMYPMISSSAEIEEIIKLEEEVKSELKINHKNYGEIKRGIMIETPAAAIISDELIKYVDFFSIGTNDLIQYTLAADRLNINVKKYYDADHPAIMKLIELIVLNAHKESKKVGICGEMASNLKYTEKFISIGVDELSVSPTMILQLKANIYKNLNKEFK